MLGVVTRTSRGWPYRETRGGSTQYAQRTGETVSGMKTTAGDSENGHKGRAVRCRPLVELRPDKNLSCDCQPVHFKVSLATVYWSIWIQIISLANTREAGVNLTYFGSK
ncbi:hypothetical protein DPMN_063483 [Dreissena polymorpha]|uniref:Uncharacterized protein n=1 Tax=Dreissena polymorpha TaxID=45954 RepID=A0A9D4CBS3_DREPO|nr:hypothetical protein DPMN_063483 [Dreissena polymorpha]